MDRGGASVEATTRRRNGNSQFRRRRQHGPLVSSAREKLIALFEVAARVFLSPFLFVASLLVAHRICVWDEPKNYQSPSWRRYLARKAAKNGKSLRRSLVRATLSVLRRLTSAAEFLSVGRAVSVSTPAPSRSTATAPALSSSSAKTWRRRRRSSEGGVDDDEDDVDDDDEAVDDDLDVDADGGDARLVLRRFAEAARDSVTLTFQAVVYYATLHVLSFFAIEKAIFAFRSDLEKWICRVGGVWHVTADGRKLPYTLPSAMDADFSTPGYNPGRGFPYGEEEEEGDGGGGERATRGAVDGGAAAAVGPRFARPDDPRNAHFASLLCKAVYEDSAVVADLVRYKWRMRLAGHGRVPAHWTRDHWVPDLVWAVAESERGVALALKGADPLWQVNLRADPPLSKRGREGVVGKVHCGLWRGLHQEAPGAEPGVRVVDLILETLRQTGAGGAGGNRPKSSSLLSRRRRGSAGGGRRVPAGRDDGAPASDDTANDSGGERDGAALPRRLAPPSRPPKPIFLCGHSLGGGLAALLAAVIAGKHPDLSSRVAGVFTFAAPRFGDEEFARHFSEVYRGRAFRYVHASDMVCKLPPGFGYGHHASERFITSFPTRKANASASGRILREEVDGAELMNKVARLEDRAAHAFHFAKLALAAAGLERWFESSVGLAAPARWWWGRSARREEEEKETERRRRQRPSVVGGPTPSSRVLLPRRSSSSSLSVPPPAASSTSTRKESRVRLALRWALLAVPGFSDHFLCEYERALRAEVVAAEERAAAEAEARAREALLSAAAGRATAATVDVRRAEAESDEVSTAAAPLPPAPPSVRTSAFAAAAAVAPSGPPLSPFSASLRTAGSGSVTAALRVGVPPPSSTQQTRGQQQQQPKAVSPLAAAAAMVRGQLSRAFPSFI